MVGTYRLQRIGKYDYELADDVIVSPDKKTVKIIEPYTDRVIIEKVENFTKIDFVEENSRAKYFSRNRIDDHALPLGWKEAKNVKTYDTDCCE